MAYQLEWKDAFSVGHPDLDMEHRRMVARINELCSGEPATNFAQSIQSLTLFVKDHFDHENAALRKIIDGGSDILARAGAVIGEALKHIHDHEIALTQLKAIEQAAVDAGVDALPRHCEALQIWFIDHAIRHDAHLKSVFQAF